MEQTPIQYISDENGKTTGVIVPIDFWREITSELETSYLLSSRLMTRRLLEARERSEGMAYEVVREKLGI